MSDAEVERLRLALSTFRDGSGQFVNRIRAFMPDFLDFERATAFVCGGTTAAYEGGEAPPYSLSHPAARGDQRWGDRLDAPYLERVTNEVERARRRDAALRA